MDLFLKLSRIIKRRTLAKKLCEEGRIKVNNIVARASKNIIPGDIITIEQKNRIRTYCVISIPQKSTKITKNEIAKLLSEEDR
ncbi:MAG: RNA-binding S4 domain-containing protein [Candidatus Coatesbacteria bacterium]|nr:MAG: RNA-binding S4 domain-containing protein [Candidatus Coatesbacteria bacterium]RLC45106.1 MAG: RNA-binding S4 domain-containing protein [Candidatus Coatesbacteria bacterium]HEC80280.1 RNA-binding S4 domain-containing protein [Bacillota bacterium]